MIPKEHLGFRRHITSEETHYPQGLAHFWNSIMKAGCNGYIETINIQFMDSLFNTGPCFMASSLILEQASNRWKATQCEQEMKDSTLCNFC